jgi:hypothetical protein
VLTIKDYYRFPKHKGDVGMELEVESETPLPDHIEGDHWEFKGEGSLRNIGAEYVTRGPISIGVHKTVALRKLCDTLLDKKYKVIRDCPRTSFHVHHNVLDFTPLQVWTAATAYWLIENALMEYCGESRKGNKFCLRLKDAEGVLNFVYQDLKDKTRPFYTVRTDRVRYAGLNLAAVSKFGSLELRGMDGRIDAKVMDTWSTETNRLLHRAVQYYRSPADLLDKYFREGPEMTLARLLNPDFAAIIRSYPGWREGMEENSGTLCEMAYFHSWDRWEKDIQKVSKTNKEQWQEQVMALQALENRARPVRVRPQDFVIVDDAALQPVNVNIQPGAVFWHHPPAGNRNDN